MISNPWDDDSQAIRRASGRGLRLVALTLAIVVSAVTHAGAREDDGESSWTRSSTYKVGDSEVSEWRVGAWAGGEYQAETDLDGTGNFKYWMINGGATASTRIGERTSLALQGDYRMIAYEFDDVVRRATNSPFDPWENVHVFRLNPLITYQFAESWSLLAGPIFEFSGEENADFADSARGGGLLGVGWQGKGIYVAFGAIVLSEIEDDARFQPLLVFDWAITEDLSLGIKGDTSRGGELRFGYVFQDLTLSAGIGFRRERYRLNGDSGRLPAATRSFRQDGVGEESATLAKFTIGWDIDERFTLEAYGGATLDGEFRLEEEDGDKVGDQDYDEAGFGGVNLRIRF